MNLLFVLNIGFYFFLLILKVRYLGNKLVGENYLNPFIIIFLFQLPIEISRVIIGPFILIDHGILDFYFNISVFMSSLTLVCDFIILFFSWKISSQKKLVIDTFSFKIKPTKMLLVGVLFYCLFLIFLFLLSSHSFGFFNWIFV